MRPRSRPLVPPLVAALLALVAGGCSAPRGVVAARTDAGRENVEQLRSAFRRDNPGYDLRVEVECALLGRGNRPRIVFVQAGAGRARVMPILGGPRRDSEVTVGDVVCVRPDEVLNLVPPMTVVVIETPEALPEALPTFVRPDWDPRITDTPGGCATETGAYRRILLTWVAENGPYVYRALNAHRVRIQDSFTHYHPRDGGFAELYLVQMAGPDARLITSESAARIESPDSIDAEEARGLLTARPLAAGDLVYLPRGTVHRGIGGALVQVITVPGFRPGAEIGVDHCLRAIAERTGANVLYNEAASAGPVVR